MTQRLLTAITVLVCMLTVTFCAGLIGSAIGSKEAWGTHYEDGNKTMWLVTNPINGDPR